MVAPPVKKPPPTLALFSESFLPLAIVYGILVGVFGYEILPLRSSGRERAAIKRSKHSHKEQACSSPEQQLQIIASDATY